MRIYGVDFTSAPQHMDCGIPEVNGIGVWEGWIPDPGLLPEDYKFYANLGLSSSML